MSFQRQNVGAVGQVTRAMVVVWSVCRTVRLLRILGGIVVGHVVQSDEPWRRPHWVESSRWRSWRARSETVFSMAEESARPSVATERFCLSRSSLTASNEGSLAITSAMAWTRQYSSEPERVSRASGGFGFDSVDVAMPETLLEHRPAGDEGNSAVGQSWS